MVLIFAGDYFVPVIFSHGKKIYILDYLKRYISVSPVNRIRHIFSNSDHAILIMKGKSVEIVHHRTTIFILKWFIRTTIFY